ncbi:cytidine deaminase [Sneathiella chungangensis]|uniref:Cytidine deaminase n=1 Tax=Sneathiella chungangensis TaxID=1418234 RepID=A0A845MIW3_9PROT|nr:cytidine deaminase [Sneathiella chungangensis]MZR23552.1 cytidine deaminase [Sneathiella chungangensis]
MTEIDLKAKARDAMANAYSPYSRFKVGAAILTEAGNVFTGCNVENISYGLSICAERNAIVHAVAVEGPGMKLKEIVVTNHNENGDSGACSPCGACRQFMIEFSSPSTQVTYPGESGDVVTTVKKLLPESFRF